MDSHLKASPSYGNLVANQAHTRVLTRLQYYKRILLVPLPADCRNYPPAAVFEVIKVKFVVS